MRRRWIWIGILVVGAVLRLPSLRVAILNEDEALYAAGAAAMQAGDPPYRAWTDSKPPGLFYAYQAVFALFGRYHMTAVHAVTILWVLATALVLGRLAGRVVPGAGPWTALVYVVATTVQRPTVLATQAEIVFALPLAVAALVLLTPSLARAAVAGALVAVATFVKPTAAALLVAVLVWLVVPFRRRPAFGRAAAFAVGFAAVWGIVWAAFATRGLWDDLVFYSFRWPLQQYIPAGYEDLPFWARLATKVGPWLVLLAVPWTLAVVAARRNPGTAMLFVLWTGAALAMLTLGGRFFDQYFPAVVTPLSVLAGLGAAGTTRPRAVLAGLAVPAVLCLAGSWRFDATLDLLGVDSRPPHGDVSRYVREHTAPDDRIFVWGYFPLIYVAADRLPASRFVAANLLTGYSVVSLAGAGARDDDFALPDGIAELLDDLERHRAAVIVDTAPADFHHFGRYPLARYPRLAAYVAANYRREAELDGAVVYLRR